MGAPYPALALGQVKLISPSNLNCMRFDPLSSFHHFTHGKPRYKSARVLPRDTQLGGDKVLLRAQAWWAPEASSHLRARSSFSP